MKVGAMTAVACPECGLGLELVRLGKHLRAHRNYQPYACVLCRCRFYTFADAELHFALSQIHPPATQPQIIEDLDPDTETHIAALIRGIGQGAGQPPPQHHLPLQTPLPRQPPPPPPSATPAPLRHHTNPYAPPPPPPQPAQSEPQPARTEPSQPSAASSQSGARLPHKTPDLSDASLHSAPPTSFSTADTQPSTTPKTEPAPSPPPAPVPQPPQPKQEPALSPDPSQTAASSDLTLEVKEEESEEVGSDRSEEVIQLGSSTPPRPALASDDAGPEAMETSSVSQASGSSGPSPSWCRLCSKASGADWRSHVAEHHLHQPTFRCRRCPFVLKRWYTSEGSRAAHFKANHRGQPAAFEDLRPGLVSGLDEWRRRCFPPPPVRNERPALKAASKPAQKTADKSTARPPPRRLSKTPAPPRPRVATTPPPPARDPSPIPRQIHVQTPEAQSGPSKEAGGPKLACAQCLQTVPEADLQSHLLLRHLKKPRWGCRACNSFLSYHWTPVQVQLHMATKHRGQTGLAEDRLGDLVDELAKAKAECFPQLKEAAKPSQARQTRAATSAAARTGTGAGAFSAPAQRPAPRKASAAKATPVQSSPKPARKTKTPPKAGGPSLAGAEATKAGSCLSCGVVVGSNKNAQKSHVLKAHLKTPRAECRLCGDFRSFQWVLSDLRQHLGTVHQVKQVSTTDSAKVKDHYAAILRPLQAELPNCFASQPNFKAKKAAA